MRPECWLIWAATLIRGRQTNPKEGILREAGDTTMINGVVITLHEDKEGRLFASAISTTTIKTYGDHTHTHSFEAAARVEDHLASLKARRTNGTTIWSTTVIPGEASSEGTKCDCILAPLTDVMVATQPRRVRWKFHHEETPIEEGCPLHTNQVYETLMSQPATLRPVCSIVPTRWMNDVLDRMRKLKPAALMDQMNELTSKPCVVEGSYNMRSLPRGRTALKGATSMIDCALQCLFMTKCSTWTFDQEGPPRCWVINTGYLRPKFNQSPGGPYVTGGKECLPCILRRRLEVIAMNGKTDARRLCDLDTTRGWETTARCACSQRETLAAHEKWIQDAHHEARKNTIRRTKIKTRGNIANTLDSILRELRTTHRGLVGLGTALTTPVKAGTKPANWTQTLPLVKKFMELIGPQATVYSKIVPVKALRQTGGAAGPGIIATRNHSTTEYLPESMNPEVDLRRLGAGIRATGDTVRQTLLKAKEFLEASEEKKWEALRMQGGMPGYKELHGDPNVNIPDTANALVITVDTGTEAAQLAVFPHEGAAEARTISAVPLPTVKRAPGLESPIIQGRWTSPNLYNRERITEELPEKCALELLTATRRPLHCEGPEHPKERRAYTQVAVDHRGTITRLARFHTNGELSLPCTVSCGNERFMLDLLGITLIAIGEACSIKDGTGRTLAYAINPKGAEEQDRIFKILLNRSLQILPTTLDAKDGCQLALALALITCLIGITAWKGWKRYREKGEKGQTPPKEEEEVEMERMHPEAGTPQSPATPPRS